MTHIQTAAAVALIVGWCAAHAAGFLTKAHAPQWMFGAVTTVLAALAGVLPTVVWNQRDSWHTYALNVFLALFGATMAHRSQIPEAIRAATPHVGVTKRARPAR